MVNAIITGFFNFVLGLVSLITAPIDNLINSSIPQFGDILNLFSSFLNYILSFIPWILSWFHIPAYLLSTLLLYIVAKITISHVVHAVKLALAWWRTLKP